MAARQLDPDTAHSPKRNVRIYDDQGHIIGGLLQNGSFTQKELYQMFDVFVLRPTAWRIYHLETDASTGAPLEKNSDNLPPGNYVILSPAGDSVNVVVSTDRPPRRVLTKGESSEKETPRKKYFKEQIRARDQDCAISGVETVDITDFTSFHAAHIYPVARERHWDREGYQSWISDTSDAQQIGATKIHSPQNGLLMLISVHELFDSFRISINLDSGYKIVSFVKDILNIDGRTLDHRCLVPGNNRVSDACLRWHYRQAVLGNVKGGGEAPWDMKDHDGEAVADIIQMEDGPLRMELELFNRLGAGTSSPEIESH